MGSPNQQEQQYTFDRDTVQTKKRLIITGATTLTAAQSGAMCVWNSATGYTFTLPIITADTVGIWYDFFVAVTNTATACKIITGVATNYITGSPLVYINNTTPGANPGPKGFLFDPAASIAVVMGGTDTTAGGVAGTSVRLTAVTTTLWGITGLIVGAGTIVTPASAS